MLGGYGSNPQQLDQGLQEAILYFKLPGQQI